MQDYAKADRAVVKAMDLLIRGNAQLMTMVPFAGREGIENTRTIINRLAAIGHSNRWSSTSNHGDGLSNGGHLGLECDRGF